MTALPLRPHAQSAALGGLTFTLSLIGLASTHATNGVAPLWFGNAVLLALICRFPELRRRTTFAAAFGGMTLANTVSGLAVHLSLLFAALNLLEIYIGFLFVEWFWDERSPAQSLRNILTFLIAGAIAALMTAGPSGVVEAVFRHDDFWDASLRWFAADALGMVVIGSLVLVAGCSDCAKLMRTRRAPEIGFVALVVAGSTVLVFNQARYPLLFILIPVLVLATFRLRFIGAALSVLLLGIIASVATMHGNGPIAAALSTPDERMLFLQLFLAVAVLTAIPLAAVLVEREGHLTIVSEKERRFRQLVERTPLAIFECDRTGRIVFGNDRFVRDYGDGPHALSDRISQVQRDAARTIWAQAMRNHSPVSGEWDVVDDAGRPCRTSVSLIPSAPGLWIGTAIDIDERYRHEARLERSEQQYRLLAEHSNDMIVRIGLDGIRRYVSPASKAILGYAPAELVGEAPIASIHPEDRARVERVCRSLLEGAREPICVYRQRRADGSYAWLEATYRLVTDDDGAPVEFVASVRDVGRRRDAELESAAAIAGLEESRRLLQMAEQMVGVGHWRLDAATQHLFWSDEVYRIHGRVVGDIPPLDQAIAAYHPDDRVMVADHVGLALRDGVAWDFRARLIRQDGSQRHVRTSGQAERAPDGTILGVVGVFQDITDAVDAEAALIAARDDARASTEAKSAFLATMSHEIRTPMTGVLGMIDLLRGDLPPQDRKRFFDNLEQSASLLMTVLDDVLDFSKIESRTFALEMVDFDPVEIVRNTLDLFHHGASQKGLLLTMAGPTGHQRLRGDPTRLQQILSNLISNAIKFTAAGGIDVKVRLAREGRRHRMFVEVADTGIGIDPTAAPQLFEPFVQGDASTTRRFGGTGLGLAISRRLVEAMSGRIAFDSTPNIGTTFRFDVELDDPRDDDDGSTVANGMPFRKLAILLAEDNQINRALVETLVRRAGHDITSVENGRLAVEAAAERRFDILLMDMQMPEMDGVTATRTIRAGAGPCASAPIVALTADASAERRRAYENIGLTGFLTKPIDSGLLVERLTLLAARVPGNDPSTTPPAPTGEVFDEAKLDRLEAAMGAGAIDRLLGMLDEELRTRPAALQRLIAIGATSAIATEAHALKGAAFNIGAVLVGDIARRIETQGDAGHDLSQLAQELMAAAHATRAAIDDRARRRPRS